MFTAYGFEILECCIYVLAGAGDKGGVLVGLRQSSAPHCHLSRSCTYRISQCFDRLVSSGSGFLELHLQRIDPGVHIFLRLFRRLYSRLGAGELVPGVDDNESSSSAGKTAGECSTASSSVWCRLRTCRLQSHLASYSSTRRSKDRTRRAESCS